MNVLDFEVFFLWLAAHRSDEVVGAPGRYFHSPLAAFLSQQEGCVMGEDGMRYGRASIDVRQWKLLPMWAQWFARLGEGSFGDALTAYEAVTLLAHVEQMLVPVLVA